MYKISDFTGASKNKFYVIDMPKNGPAKAKRVFHMCCLNLL